MVWHFTNFDQTDPKRTLIVNAICCLKYCWVVLVGLMFVFLLDWCGSFILVYQLIPMVLHTFASLNRVSISPDNGLSPVRRQAIIWTSAELSLLIRPLRTNFSEILIKVQNIFIHENASENIVSDMVTILFRGSWVNDAALPLIKDQGRNPEEYGSHWREFATCAWRM